MSDADQIRALHAEGRLREARARLAERVRGRMTRAERLEFAALAGLIYWPECTISLLHRTVTGDSRSGKRATPEEVAEYARALLRVGLLDSGIKLLESIDVSKVPSALASLTLAYFWRYEWTKAKPYVEASARIAPPGTEQSVNAKIDLGLVYLHGDLDPKAALPPAEAALAEASKVGFRNGRWQALNLRAQAFFRLGQASGMARTLDEMDALYPEEGQTKPLKLWSAMWRSLAVLKEDRSSRQARESLATVRKHMAQLKSGWFLRTCETYLAVLSRDPEHLARVTFGSPRKGMVANLIREFWSEGAATLPPWYDFRVGPPRGKPAGRLEVINGTHSFGDGALKTGQLPQRILAAITSDFFDAPDVSRIYEHAYQDDRLDPLYYGMRVRQGILRLRRWLEDEGIPVTIEEKDGHYRLASREPVMIRLHGPVDLGQPSGARAPASRLDDLLLRVRAGHAGGPVSARDVEKLLGCRRSTAVALLREACGAGLMVREGAGPASRYRLKG